MPVRTAVYIDARHARIDPADRGLAYGDGLFETMLAEDGRIRWLDYHLDRLEEGCRRLAIPAPSRDELKSELAQRVAQSPGRSSVKLILTRGAGPRGYAPPADPLPTVIIATAAIPSGDALRPVRAGIVDFRLAENENLAGIKHLCRIEQVLIRIELADRKLEEGIVLTRSGHVAGCSAANVFLIADDVLRTPVIRTAGIAGVMRRAVIESARGLGIDVAEADIDPAELALAQSIFLTNALVGIRTISQLNDHAYVAHPHIDALRAALAEQGDA